MTKGEHIISPFCGDHHFYSFFYSEGKLYISTYILVIQQSTNLFNRFSCFVTVSDLKIGQATFQSYPVARINLHDLLGATICDTADQLFFTACQRVQYKLPRAFLVSLSPDTQKAHLPEAGSIAPVCQNLLTRYGYSFFLNYILFKNNLHYHHFHISVAMLLLCILPLPITNTLFRLLSAGHLFLSRTDFILDPHATRKPNIVSICLHYAHKTNHKEEQSTSIHYL